MNHRLRNVSNYDQRRRQTECALHLSGNGNLPWPLNVWKTTQKPFETFQTLHCTVVYSTYFCLIKIKLAIAKDSKNHSDKFLILIHETILELEDHCALYFHIQWKLAPQAPERSLKFARFVGKALPIMCGALLALSRGTTNLRGVLCDLEEGAKSTMSVPNLGTCSKTRRWMGCQKILPIRTCWRPKTTD